MTSRELRAQARACRARARATVEAVIATRRLVLGSPAGNRGAGGYGRCGAHALLPALAESSAMARQLVGGLCTVTGHRDIAEVGELLVSETVTNAIVHTGTQMVRVIAAVRRGVLTVSVWDDDPRFPVAGEPEAGDTRGRGLLLLNRLAGRWGVVNRLGGKAVWFSLSSTLTGAARGGAGGAPHDSPEGRGCYAT